MNRFHQIVVWGQTVELVQHWSCFLIDFITLQNRLWTVLGKFPSATVLIWVKKRCMTLNPYFTVGDVVYFWYRFLTATWEWCAFLQTQNLFSWALNKTNPVLLWSTSIQGDISGVVLSYQQLCQMLLLILRTGFIIVLHKMVQLQPKEKSQ